MKISRFVLLGSFVAGSLASQEVSAQQYERVSVKRNGGELQHGAGQGIAISSDGQFVAFTAIDDDVTGSGSPVYSVFLRNRAVGTTSRISVSQAGGPPNASSYTPSISGDGRFVAFASDADDLGPADTDAATDVYVRDRWNGTTVLASSGFTQETFNPKVSANGKYVGFGDGWDVFLHEVATGNVTVVIPGSGLAGQVFTGISADGQLAVCRAKGPQIAREGSLSGFGGYDTQDAMGRNFIDPSDPLLTADGRLLFVSAYLVRVYAWYYPPFPWYSGSSGGIHGWWNMWQQHSYVLDRATGVAAILRDRHGFEITASSVSATGAGITFLGSAPPFTQAGLCVCDTDTGTTRLLVADPAVFENVISGNSRKVAFLSSLSTLVPGDTNNSWDVFVTDGL